MSAGDGGLVEDFGDDAVGGGAFDFGTGVEHEPVAENGEA
jgi:hypothetical protein